MHIRYYVNGLEVEKSSQKFSSCTSAQLLFKNQHEIWSIPVQTDLDSCHVKNLHTCGRKNFKNK